MVLLPFERWICLLLSAGLITMLVAQLSRGRQQRNLVITHSLDSWTIQFPHPLACATGGLVQAGYRSAWLIVLAIQSDDTALHRVAIWHDQVTPREFSYLHQQLAFAAKPPSRRRPAVWLKDIISIQGIRFWQSRGDRYTTVRGQTRR